MEWERRQEVIEQQRAEAAAERLKLKRKRQHDERVQVQTPLVISLFLGFMHAMCSA
jgi:hypothetical protein